MLSISALKKVKMAILPLLKSSYEFWHKLLINEIDMI